MAGRLETALAATGYEFRHYGWSHAPAGDFGVWGEDYARDLVADGVHAERGTRCFVALYTRDDSAAPRAAVEAALNGLRAPWKLNAVIYEADTGYIHFEWLVSMLGGL